ncbi:hypothetical protein [Cerasicoccus frondis]|nr:hypothetical protein [Cerasicoccus frondis]
MKPDSSEQKQEFTPEELAKAERATWILYGVMAVFIIAPFVTAWLIS